MRGAKLWIVSLLAKLNAVMVYLIRKAVGNLRSPAICLRPRAGRATVMKLFHLMQTAAPSVRSAHCENVTVNKLPWNCLVSHCRYTEKCMLTLKYINTADDRIH